MVGERPTVDTEGRGEIVRGIGGRGRGGELSGGSYIGAEFLACILRSMTKQDTKDISNGKPKPRPTAMTVEPGYSRWPLTIMGIDAEEALGSVEPLGCDAATSDAN